MTPEERLSLYARAATYAFGPRWQSDAARYHGVAIRTVQRWVAGEQPVPDGIYVEMAHLLGQRWAEVETLMYEMHGVGIPGLSGPINAPDKTA